MISVSLERFALPIQVTYLEKASPPLLDHCPAIDLTEIEVVLMIDLAVFSVTTVTCRV